MAWLLALDAGDTPDYLDYLGTCVNFELVNKPLAISIVACLTNRVHVSFLKNHPDLTATRYYRLDVVHGLSRTSLEDAS